MTNKTISATRAAALRVQRERERGLLQRDLVQVASRSARLESIADELEELLSCDVDPLVLLRTSQGAEMTVYHREKGCGQLCPADGRRVEESRALAMGLHLCRFCASSLTFGGAA